MKKMDYTLSDLVIVFFLILFSGYMGIGSVTPITIPLFIISVILFLFKRCKLGWGEIVLLILFFILLLFQRAIWGGSMGNVYNTGLQLISFALLAACVEKSFLRLFPKVIFWIAGISLFFYVVDQLGGHSLLLATAKSFPITLENQNTTRDAYSFLFYTVDVVQSFRNSGPFFEPGRYVVVLLIAIAMNFEQNKKINDIENIVLIVSVLTTLSLSGIATLFVVWIISITKKGAKKILLLFPIIIIIFILAFPYISQSEYFGEKLLDNYEKIDDPNSRFGALLYLWSQVLDSPFVGYGPTIYITDEFDALEVSSPNGWGELMRYWGIPMSFIYFILLYKSSITVFHKIRGGNWPFFIASIMVAFPQSVMMTPLYYVLLFLGAQSYKLNRNFTSQSCREKQQLSN